MKPIKEILKSIEDAEESRMDECIRIQLPFTSLWIGPIPANLYLNLHRSFARHNEGTRYEKHQR
jgi:hypothetical protein